MTRVVEVKPGTKMRIRGLRWDDGWRYGSPVALIDPVLKVYEDGRSLERAIEDLCIDACVCGVLKDEEAWRWEAAPGGSLAYLRRKFYRTHVQRVDCKVRFIVDDDGELWWEA